MTGPSRGECEGGLQSLESVDSGSAPCGTDSSGVTEGSYFGKKRGEVATEQESCERVCRRRLRSTPCDLEQSVEPRHRWKNRFDAVDSITVSRAGMIRGTEHTPVRGELGSLTGQVWMDGRRVKGLYRRSVRLRLTYRAVPLEKSIAPVRGKVQSRVGRRFQHYRESRDVVGNEKVVVRVDGSRAMTGVVVEGVVSRTSVLRLREYPSAGTRSL